MPKILDLEQHSDHRGDLTVIEKILPFEIKRVYYITNADGAKRAGHKHKVTRQAAVCVNGSCIMKVHKPDGVHEVVLDSPSKCLLLEPEDWHEIENFENNAVLLVLASEHFNAADYVDDI